MGSLHFCFLLEFMAVGMLVGWMELLFLAGKLHKVGWLVGWLVGWMVGWQVGRLVGQ